MWCFWWTPLPFASCCYSQSHFKSSGLCLAFVWPVLTAEADSWWWASGVYLKPWESGSCVVACCVLSAESCSRAQSSSSQLAPLHFGQFCEFTSPDSSRWNKEEIRGSQSGSSCRRETPERRRYGVSRHLSFNCFTAGWWLAAYWQLGASKLHSCNGHQLPDYLPYNSKGTLRHWITTYRSGVYFLHFPLIIATESYIMSALLYWHDLSLCSRQ